MEPNEEITALIEELTTNGKVILTSDSREEITQQSNDLVSHLPRNKWTRTIIQYRPDTFDYEQTIFYHQND